MDEFLKIASQMGSPDPQEGGGGGGSCEKEEPGKEGKDRNQKKGPEEKKDPLQDNQPGKGQPESGDRSPPDKKPPTDTPPPKSPKGAPPRQELKGVFFAKLPDKVKEAVLNGDWDQVPEKYRDLVREWTKALGEADKAEAEKEGR